MGGKGQKRREKNYRAAHGDDSTRLPPPPEPSSIDALPSKLRQLIALTSQDGERKVKRTANGEQKPPSVANVNTKRSRTGKENDKVPASINSDDGNPHDDTDQRKKKKRKKTKVEDLRFAAEMEKLGVRSSKRERKKEYFKAKKNKKNKKPSADDLMYAPKRDEVKFGDIVLAPPKLAVTPKAPKKQLDASQQRLRLQAVEAYRNRRQWMSRPGTHIPQPIEELPSPL